MTIESALRSMIIADETVEGLTGSRVYPGWLPQSVTLPCITYTKVSGERGMNVSAPSGYAHPRFQVDTWATTYAGAKTLANAVRQALNGVTNTTISGVRIGSIVMLSERDDFETDTEIHRVSMDFSVWHDE